MATLPNQPMVVYNRPMQRAPVQYAQKHAIVSGTIQVVIGWICIVINIVDIVYYGPLRFVGHGFWCGIMFVVAGSIGIGSGKHVSKCLIIAYMVMSILAAVFCAPLVAMGILGAWIADDDYEYSDGTVVTSAIWAVLAGVEAAIAIWASTLGCRSNTGCCEPEGQPIVLQVIGTDGSSQMALLGQPQPPLVYGIPQTSGGAYMIQPGVNQGQWMQQEESKTARNQNTHGQTEPEPDTISNRSDPPPYDNFNI